MKTTAQLFEGYKVSEKRTRRSERGDLIDFFHEKMNFIRKSDGYKEWNKSTLAYFLSLYTTEQLYHLRRKCEQSKNFGACFNSFVFPKKLSTG